MDCGQIGNYDKGKIKRRLHFVVLFGRKRIMSIEKRMINVGGNAVTFVRVEGHNNDGLPNSVLKKYVPRDELLDLGNFLRSRHLRIAFTTGVFDLIHVGHKRYLELAATLGDALVVGINSDKSVRRLKGKDRPTTDQNQRLEMVCALGFVSYATIFGENTGAKVIKLLKPDAYLCVEGSWDGDLETKAEVVAISKHNGEVYYAPRQSPVVSTTAILERIGLRMKQDILSQLRDAMEEEKHA
jgi:rfaE bifunctional protein nucleotidyltransferase chain/domain